MAPMMPSRFAPSRRRIRGRGAHGNSGPKRAETPRFYSHVAVALVGFALVWGTALWLTHDALSTWPRQRFRRRRDPQQQEQEQRHEVPYNDSNPYFGWQPTTPATMECSWRKCFQSEHRCSTCRDSPQDMEGDKGLLPTKNDDNQGADADSSPSSRWIPDVTMLHRMRLVGKDAHGNPWPPPLDDELCEDIGPSGGTNDVNKQAITQIPVVAELPSEAEGGPKLMCMLYTMESAHATTIRAIRETWASHCDGFLAFSTASDPRIPAIALPHQGEESYYNMWQKVRSIWKFVGTHYIDQFDWFFQGGDDLFVLPQNLRNYLATLDPTEDHFVGRRFKAYGENSYFNSGGAGYALSRETLRKYVIDGWSHPKCHPEDHTSTEDVMIADCLRNVFGIGLTDTRDEQGRERFHPFAPGTHLHWKPPEEGKHNWYNHYNREWPVKLGTECCAPDSVSFHYIRKPAMVRHIYALLFLCSSKGL